MLPSYHPFVMEAVRVAPIALARALTLALALALTLAALALILSLTRKQAGIAPNAVTLSALINACGRAGRLTGPRGAFRVLADMQVRVRVRLRVRLRVRVRVRARARVRVS